MWSVNISVSPCSDADRIGYDYRQINRIVVRCAQYFLNRNMRVIFGHDWRDDGVMQAIADFAVKVASSARVNLRKEDCVESDQVELPRMLNIVPTAGGPLSKLALDARVESGGVLEVVSTNLEDRERLSKLTDEIEHLPLDENGIDSFPAELTMLRRWITTMLNPGCRICLGGKLKGFKGKEPGVLEEARIALEFKKPLYLLGGFGGATRRFGNEDEYGKSHYWNSNNGLEPSDKEELFKTTDIEYALRLISSGIENYAKHQ